MAGFGGRTFLWVRMPDGKRVALQYPALIDPDWQTKLLGRLVETYHGEPSQQAP